VLLGVVFLAVDDIWWWSTSKPKRNDWFQLSTQKGSAVRELILFGCIKSDQSDQVGWQVLPNPTKPGPWIPLRSGIIQYCSRHVAVMKCIHYQVQGSTRRFGEFKFSHTYVILKSVTASFQAVFCKGNLKCPLSKVDQLLKWFFSTRC
jgi:hypothetical protein